LPGEARAGCQIEGGVKMKKLRGRFKGENNYFIDGYRVSNEIADGELYIYNRDGDLLEIIDMPDFWEKYLFEAREVDNEIELRFENYIIETLGL
jgi:hypothetical protein